MLSLGLDTRGPTPVDQPGGRQPALLAGLDQTRTVGLVTLPGAFVGMLLGGASPIRAAAVQLLVFGRSAAWQAIATLVTMELIAGDVLR